MADDEDEDDIPWELLDEDNWLRPDDNYIEDAETVELKLAEGALDHVAGAICHKVKHFKLYHQIFLIYDNDIFNNNFYQINYF